MVSRLQPATGATRKPERGSPQSLDPGQDPVQRHSRIQIADMYFVQFINEKRSSPVPVGVALEASAYETWRRNGTGSLHPLGFVLNVVLLPNPGSHPRAN